MREVCGYTLEGPRAKGTRNAPTWRRSCQAAPMRIRPGLEALGFVQGRCFQHQPPAARNAVYGQATKRGAEEYRRVHGHWPGEAHNA